MTPRTLATVLLRILAIWIILESVLSALDLFIGSWNSTRGSGWTSYPMAPQMDASIYLHDSYYVVAGNIYSMIPLGARCIIGALLLWRSGPLARLLTRDVQSPESGSGSISGAASGSGSGVES